MLNFIEISMLELKKRAEERIDMVVTWLVMHFLELKVTRLAPTIKDASQDLVTMQPELSLGLGKLSPAKEVIVTEIAAIKVLGTDIQADKYWWLNLDVIEYVKHHPERNIWLAICLKYPVPRIVWFKPAKNYDYHHEHQQGFVYFKPKTPGYYDDRGFITEIKTKIAYDQ